MALRRVVIRAAELKFAVDLLGGVGLHYWEPINKIYGLDIAIVNPRVYPTFPFMTVDHDGAIRTDCSSPYAMARLVGLKDRYRLAFANGSAQDRQSQCRADEPNHYLSVAILYLLTHAPTGRFKLRSVRRWSAEV